MNCIHVVEGNVSCSFWLVEANGEYMVDMNDSSLSHDFPDKTLRNPQESSLVYQSLNSLVIMKK